MMLCALCCSFMAWNWYPPVKEEDKELPPRLHGHADMDVITLLYQRTGTCAMSCTTLCHHSAHALHLQCCPAS